MRLKRPAAFAAAIALLTGGAITGVAAPAVADTPVATYAELVTAVAAASDTVVLTANISQTSSTLGVDPGDSVTIDFAGFSLTLEGAAGEAGIGVPPTSSLTLMDSVGGPLTDITGGTSAAAIGGDNGESSGSVTIESGLMATQGGDGGAGVGGGSGAAGGIYIMHGGKIQSFGGLTGGAGIGGGAGGAGGTVTITGGEVDAIGANGGAGIGGGIDGVGGVTDISGGKVTTAIVITVGGTDSGAAIGGGAHAGGGTITISGGDVVANSQGILGAGVGGAGIGGGAGSLAGTISLLGGHIKANGGSIASGAAIGTGGFSLFTSPVAAVAGTPNPGAATRSGEGIASQGVTYVPDLTPGIGYSATFLDAVNGVAGAEAELTFDYLVTFDPDGGTPDPISDQTVVWGDAATEPTPTPTKPGFVFDGWHVDTAGGALWDFADPVTEPLDLVAAWVELPSISGTPPDGAVGAAYNYAMAVSPPAATVSVASGSLPPGLSVDAAGVISGVPTTIGPFTATLRATNAAGIDDIVVQIDIVAGAPQLVTFDPDGGAPDPPDQMVGLGAKVIEPGDPAKPGFAFIEWRVGTNAGPAYDFNQVVTGPLSLVAAYGQQPTLTGPAMASGTAGDPIATVQLLTTPPGNTVGITSGTLPAGLTFNAGTLQVTGVPNGLAGTYPVTFTATNAYGLADHVVTFTIAHGVATSFTTTASDFSPNQGDTITVTTTASDGFGNSWDASADATITSNVATDVIVGNQVTFPHASPHVLNVALPNLAAQQLLIQVTARSALGLTGSDGARTALPVAILAILCGTSLMLLRRRREA